MTPFSAELRVQKGVDAGVGEVRGWAARQRGRAWVDGEKEVRG